MHLRHALAGAALGATLVLGVAAVPAQAAQPPVPTVSAETVAASCTSHLETLPIQARTDGYAKGRVYIDDSATPCSGKRIIVGTQTKNRDGSWSPLRGGLHYVPTDEFGFEMEGQWIYAGCGGTARSVYQLGSLTVTGTGYRINC